MLDKHLKNNKEELNKEYYTELKELSRKESEAIEAIERGLKGKESQAKKLNDLFAKHKGWLGKRQSLVSFKEPVVILMRNHMIDEFYENATKGKMSYVHSNGETQYIILDPRYIRSLPYAGKVIRYYLCHEDYPLPLPESPALSAEKFNMAIERISTIEKEWKAKEFKMKGEMWWKIFGGIAMLIGAIALANMLGMGDWILRIINRGGDNPPTEEIGRAVTTIGESILIWFNLRWGEIKKRELMTLI